MRLRHVARIVVATSLIGLAPVANALGASASASTTPNCRSSQLALTRGQRYVAGDVTYTALVMTNTSGTCALWGVPAIQPVGPTHHPIGPFARNLSIGEMPLRHVIARGDSVSVSFGVATSTSVRASSCHRARAVGIEVALGGFFTGRFLPLPFVVCTTKASTTTRLLAPGAKG